MSETRTFQGHTYTRNGPGERWVLAGPAASSGGVVVTDPYRAPKSAAETARAQAEADPVLLKAQRDRAVADAAKAQADARAATLTNDEVSPDVLASIKAGKPIRLQDLAPGDRGIVSGLLQGNLPAGQRSIASKAMLPYIKMAMSVDPSFNANVFTTRGALLKDYTSGDTSKNITSLRTAIGHLGQLQTQISGTYSTPVVPLNALGNAIDKNFLGESGPGLFDQTAGHVSEEATKVFRPQGGAESDVARNIADLTSSASSSQKNDNIKNLLMLFQSRLAALDTKFKQGMGAGANGVQIIDPKTQQIVNQILGPGGAAGGGGPGSGGGPGGTPLWKRGPLDANGVPTALLAGLGQRESLFGPGGVFDKQGFEGVAAAAAGAGSASKLSTGADGRLVERRPDGTMTIWENPEEYAKQQFQDRYLDAMPWKQYTKAYSSYFGVPEGEVPTGLTADVGGNAGGDVTADIQGRDTVMGKADTVVRAAANGATAGLANVAEAGANSLLTGKPFLQNLRLQSNIDAADFQNRPGYAIPGTLAGGAFGALGAESAVARGLSKSPMVFRGMEGADRAAAIAPWGARGGDALYGGVSGATSNPDAPLTGGAEGAALGLGGGMAGRAAGKYIVAPVARRIGQSLGMGVPKPSSVDLAIAKALGKNNLGGVQDTLAQGSALDLPMNLADASPGLRSLAGASVRRSPAASGVAENLLFPRGRGQIDRFQSAIERDLGPTTNVPQLTDDMMNAARTKAGPLYEQAYAAPPISSPKIDSILSTPFGKQALGRAMTIARNERVDPNTLSVTFDAAGDPVMMPIPSTRTLDYVKRGMDDVLEQNRNPITGQLNLDEMGRAQLGVKNDLLGEMDRLNPAYGQARAAFAGPAQETDWIRRGGQAFNQPPDALAFNMQNVAPDKMPLMQLGYRDALTQAGDRVGYSSNPYDRTLGTPAAESRLQSVYPDNPNVARLLAQRDMERTMQATSTDVLGNSKTAQRGIADQAFAGEDLPQLGLDLGLNLMTGQVPIGTMMKANLGRRIADAYTLGVGKAATAKADAIAPLLLNPNPAAASDELAATLARIQSYSDDIARRQRVFGTPLGVAGAGGLSGYADQ